MRFMSKNGFEVIMISADGEEIKDVLENEKCKHIIFSFTRKITPLQDLKTTYQLYKFLKNEKPQIVHTHTPKAGIVGMLAAKVAGVPNRLHTVAGLPLLEVSGIKRKVLNFVEKLTYKCATKVYPNSYGLKNIILEHKFTKKEKLKVVGNGSSNGIDTSYFNPKLFSKQEKQTLKNKLNIQKDDFIFIFVGRIVGDKGINELVSAFMRLDNTKSKSQNLKLLLVGPFEDELDPLEEQTKKIINSNKQIVFLGYQNDVRPYFAIADVLVFPSYREGFPNVVMQAGAMGLPSIVTNINGCNEIIIEGENGWIIPVKSSTAIEKTMELCIVKEDSFTFAKKNARRMIEERYEQHVIWNAILKEYRNLEKDV